jgi:AraC-like DNA-binding protein
MYGRRIFVYLSTMRSEEQAGVARRQAAAIRPFSDPQVRFLLHDFVRLRSWNFANLAAPFWRLYWNPTPGASIRFKGVTHALAPARIYLLPPETGFAAALARPTDHLYVHFTLGRPYTGVPPQVLSLPRTAARARMLTRIRAHAVRGTLGYPAGALALLALVAELLAELPAAVWSMPLPDKRISRVLDWMETRGFAFPPGNRDLARVAGLSTNAFIRLFSSQVGLPPMRYLLNRRVDHAAILLQHTDGSLDQIAAACGFCDRFHFSRVFQTRHAMGPARYRRERLY